MRHQHQTVFLLGWFCAVVWGLRGRSIARSLSLSLSELIDCFNNPQNVPVKWPLPQLGQTWIGISDLFISMNSMAETTRLAHGWHLMSWFWLCCGSPLAADPRSESSNCWDVHLPPCAVVVWQRSHPISIVIICDYSWWSPPESTKFCIGLLVMFGARSPSNAGWLYCWLVGRLVGWLVVLHVLTQKLVSYDVPHVGSIGLRLLSRWV